MIIDKVFGIVVCELREVKKENS